MKINFKTTALLLVLTLASVPLFAQPGQGQRRQMSEEDVKMRIEALADTLDLTEKQETQVLEFEMEYYKTIQKERQNFDPDSGDREAMREKMMKLREERDAHYKEVLNSEQYEKYTKMMENRRSEMRQRQGQGQGQGSGGDRGRGRGGN